MEKEIFINNVKETSLSVTSSVIESVKMRNVTKKAVRVYKDGFIGVAGGAGELDTEQLTDSAKENLKNNISYTYPLEKDLNMELDASKEIIEDENFINEGSELLCELSGENKDFIFSNKIILKEVNTCLGNSEGLNLKYKDRCISVELLFKEKASVNIFDGFIAYTGRSYDRKDFIKYSGDILNGYRNTVKLPHEGKLPIAVADELFLSIFRKELNGRNFMTGGSIFSGKAGNKLFSDNFTLYQTRNPDDVYLQPFFDMEGRVNDNYIYPLIENGVLKTPFTDKRTSAEFSIKNTGSASCEYDEVPDLGAPSLSVKSGRKTAKELFGGEIGILVFIASGGDFTTSGDFGTPVQLAFLYDGEKIIGRLPQLQLSSDVYRMYNEDFRGMSSDTFFRHSNDKLMIMDMDVKLL